ncbi:MAG: FtsX-like permease family protein [Acidobacteriota bacterium]
MRFLPILLSNFKRHKVRTLLTVLSLVIAFVLFGYLAAIRKAFQMGVDVVGADRLVTRHKVSIIQLLPASYQARIAQIPGVVTVMSQTWFGGIYQDPKNFFAQLPVVPDEFVKIYPEYKVDPAQFEAWKKTRTGVIVGDASMKRFGWKLGQRIPLQATIWPGKKGRTWEFDIVGTYHIEKKGGDNTGFFFRYDYFDENRTYGKGTVGWYVLRVADPSQSAAIAKKIDATFANSPAETKTETEGAFVKGWADQVGNIGAIVRAILTAVFFTILLVAGNTMAQAVRERTHELAVLKAVGFTDGEVLALVLSESTLIAVVGGGLGLLVGWLAVMAGDPTKGALPIFYYPIPDLIQGIALVFIVGLLAGLLPALQAMRLNTASALRSE